MIHLRDIDEKNFIACIDLDVKDAQKNFVAPNVYSIAESKIYPEVTIKAIYSDDQIIGFLMFGRDNEEKDKSPWLIRFMLDASAQHKGYGKEALVLTLEMMAKKYPGEAIYLSTEPENTHAIKLYERFGFVATGEIQDGEAVYIKKT